MYARNVGAYTQACYNDENRPLPGLARWANKGTPYWLAEKAGYGKQTITSKGEYAKQTI